MTAGEELRFWRAIDGDGNGWVDPFQPEPTPIPNPHPYPNPYPNPCPNPYLSPSPNPNPNPNPVARRVDWREFRRAGLALHRLALELGLG